MSITQAHAPALDTRIRRLAWILLAIVLIAFLVTIASILQPLLSGKFRMAYYTEAGIQEFNEKSFHSWERLLLIGLVSLPNVCWMFCIWPIGQLALTVGRGSLVSEHVIRQFNLFGIRLFLNAAANFLVIPVLNAYMTMRGHSKPMQDFWDFLLNSGGLDLTMAGVLVVIICQFLKAGMDAMEEARLTV